MIDKALMAVAAAAALAAAAVIGVFAVAFALYAGLSPWVGPAWAAAIVAAVMALAILIAALSMRGAAAGGRSRRRHEEEADPSLIQKVVEMAKDHPLLAVGAAVGVGIYAIRNPQLVAAVVTAFMAGKDEAS